MSITPINNKVQTTNDDNVVERFLAGLTGNTRLQAECSLKRFYKCFLIANDMNEVKDLETYRVFRFHLLDAPSIHETMVVLRQEYSPNTFNATMSILRKFFQFAWLAGVIPREKYEVLSLQVLKNVRHNTMTGQYIPKEVRNEIIQYIKAQDPNRAFRDLVLFHLMMHGLRVSEAIGLRFMDLDLADRNIYIKQSKNNKDRKVPLNNATIKLLQEWRDLRSARPQDFIICPVDRKDTLVNRSISRVAAHYIIKRWSNLVGLEFTTHDFRRSRITDLWQENVPATVIANIAGHSDLNTTKRYDRSGEAAMRQATDSVDLF